MKKQQFNEQQLKDLVSGKPVQTVEPVKEGEFCSHQNKFIQTSDVKSLPADFVSNVIINSVGEVVQATNEKGEKQFYCPECKVFIHNAELEFCGNCQLSLEKDIMFKPLQVRLEKIEKKTYSDSVGLPQNKPKKDYYSIGNDPLVWLKTWKRGN